MSGSLCWTVSVSCCPCHQLTHAHLSNLFSFTKLLSSIVSFWWCCVHFIIQRETNNDLNCNYIMVIISDRDAVIYS